MVNLKEVNEALNLYIRPQTFPLAIKMCCSSDELPQKVRIPKRDLGISITVCQGIAMARRYGWTIAISNEDQCCPHGAFVLGFVPGKGYLDGSYAESLGLGGREQFARTARALSRLEYGRYKFMLVAPLHSATFQPDLVLLFGNPAQIARLVQGALALEGGSLTSTATPGIACSGFIARPLLTGECQFILSGAGDRYFALTQDHELAFAIPQNKIDSTIKGLEVGHKSGMHRYPTPSFLRFEGQLPPAYYKFLEMLQKEEP